MIRCRANQDGEGLIWYEFYSMPNRIRHGYLGQRPAAIYTHSRPSG